MCTKLPESMNSVTHMEWTEALNVSTFTVNRQGIFNFEEEQLKILRKLPAKFLNYNC